MNELEIVYTQRYCDLCQSFYTTPWSISRGCHESCMLPGHEEKEIALHESVKHISSSSMLLLDSDAGDYAKYNNGLGVAPRNRGDYNRIVKERGLRPAA